jgi:hypothetical protein
MNVTLPSTDEIEQYGTPLEPPGAAYTGRSGRSGRWDIPLIADDEAVCAVRVLDTGSGAYWSRGDVDLHVLYARRHRPDDGLINAAHATQQAWLARALRERRELRRHLLRSGVQTTASGLMVLRTPAQLVIPTSP